MSSELEMLDKKTSDSSKVKKLRDKHLKLYDVLKKEEHERVQKVSTIIFPIEVDHFVHKEEIEQQLRHHGLCMWA